VAASVLTLVIAQRADRTLTGELVAAVCLPWVALPVAISAGVATRIALGQTAVWSLGFALLTLSVRTAKARALTQPISRILARFTRSISVVAVLLAVTLALAGVATIPEAAGLTLLAEGADARLLASGRRGLGGGGGDVGGAGVRRALTGDGSTRPCAGSRSAPPGP
jgi:hypothetical protein